MSRLCRRIGPLLLAVGLLCPAAPAQEPGFETIGEESESAGNPLYGYLGTAALGAAAIYVLCLSARR